MNEVRKLAGQTMIYGLGTIVPRFLHYAVMTPFYTRIFVNTGDYGIITEMYAWIVLLLVILTYGMETGYFRFSQKSHEDPDKVYSTAIISLLISSLIFVAAVNVFIEPVSSFMNYPENRDYIRMFAGIVAIDAFAAVPFARLRKENRAVTFSIIKLINVIITIVLVVFLLKLAPTIWENSSGWFRRVYDPEYKVGYVFAANLISSGATLIMLIPVIFKARLVFVYSLWTRMMTYSIPLLLAGLSGTVNDVLDKVILRRMIGEETGHAVVGIYGAAYKIGVLMALFIQMFRFAAEPFFFERAGRPDAKETYSFVMKYFIIIMLGIYMFLNLYLTIIQNIVPLNYQEAINIVPIISMAYLLYGIYVNHSIWFKITDKTKYAVYISLIGVVITVAINVMLIPVYGYMAAAWAHIAAYGAMIAVSFAFAENNYKVDYNLKQIIPYFIMAVAMVIFARVFSYKNIAEEIVVNTFMIILFILYAQKRDKVITMILRKPAKVQNSEK